MNNDYFEQLARSHGITPSPSVIAMLREAYFDSLKHLRYEFESHDYFSEASMVNRFIKTGQNTPGDTKQ